jgi:hypothetical protein
VASIAAKIYDSISHETYIIVLSYEGRLEEYFLDLLYLPQVAYFREPDLRNQMTALAVLNPPVNTFTHLNLWEGGVTNGD